jgi:hypothetical protein
LQPDYGFDAAQENEFTESQLSRRLNDNLIGASLTCGTILMPGHHL